MGSTSLTVNGFAFDPDVFTARFAAFCASKAITSRADFMTQWNGATAAQQASFVAKMVFGAVRFPEDGSAKPQDVAVLTSP